MNLPLESLHAGVFQPFLDTTFKLCLGEPESVLLVLVEVRLLGSRRPEASRDPFALTFRGPAGLRLPQSIHTLGHPEAGRLEIFLVQVADKLDGSLFEAIFT